MPNTDGVLCIQLVISFPVKWVGPTIIEKRTKYDSRVVVKFNLTAYANLESIVKWPDKQVVPPHSKVSLHCCLLSTFRCLQN